MVHDFFPPHNTECLASLLGTGCDQTLSPPNDESGMAESPSVFRNSFGKRVVGRDLRARRFSLTMLAERPEVVPYHTLPEISAKEEGFGPGLSHKGADKVWSHPKRRKRLFTRGRSWYHVHFRAHWRICQNSRYTIRKGNKK